jgi:hypothetical protein
MPDEIDLEAVVWAVARLTREREQKNQCTAAKGLPPIDDQEDPPEPTGPGPQTVVTVFLAVGPGYTSPGGGWMSQFILPGEWSGDRQ